jgi:hypothetical protein
MLPSWFLIPPFWGSGFCDIAIQQHFQNPGCWCFVSSIKFFSQGGDLKASFKSFWWRCFLIDHVIKKYNVSCFAIKNHSNQDIEKWIGHTTKFDSPLRTLASSDAIGHTTKGNSQLRALASSDGKRVWSARYCFGVV